MPRDAVAALARDLRPLRQRLDGHAAHPRDLQPPRERLVGILGGGRHVRVVGVHPQLAAARVDDVGGLAVVVGVRVRADEQPHVLQPQPDLRHRPHELLERALLACACEAGVQPAVERARRRRRPGSPTRCSAGRPATAAAAAAARRRAAPARHGQARDGAWTRARVVTIRAAGYDLPVAIQTSIPSEARPSPSMSMFTAFPPTEYERIVETGALEDLRVELLRGLLVDMSPQDEPHARAIQQLMMLFAPRAGPPAGADAAGGRRGLGARAGRGPRGARPRSDRPSDDCAVRRRGRRVFAAAWMRARRSSTPRAGIPTYWLVDLPAGVVRVHSKPGPEGYGSIVAKRGDDVLDAGVEGVEPTTVAALLAL